MGSRRLRTLSVHPNAALAVFDERADRRERAAARFGLPTFATLEAALAWKPDALIISTPPDRHTPYVDLALTRGLAHFVEAGIRVEPEHVGAATAANAPLSAPSCTFHFMPAIQRLEKIVPEAVGTLHGYQMFLSCNLPQWHPEEQGKFYAYHPATNAAREMTPFELFWLNRLFGAPTEALATITRRGTLPTPSEDSYLAQFQLDNGATGQLGVVMASPSRFRRGVAIGERGAVAFDLLTGVIETMTAEGKAAERIETGSIEEVTEAVYDAEMNAFFHSLTTGAPWPHSYREAAQIGGILAAMERSATTRRWECVDPALQPHFS